MPILDLNPEPRPPGGGAPNPVAPAGPGEKAVTFSHPAPVIAAMLRAMIPPPPPPQRNRRVSRWLPIVFVLAAGAVALAIDADLGFPRGAFAWLVPFSWLGVVVVMNATHPRPRRLAGWLKQRALGCVIAIAAGAAVVAFLVLYGAIVKPYADGDPDGRSWGLWVFGSLVTLVIGWIYGRLTHAQADARGDQAARLRAAVDVAEALADDAVPGKPASGWIDVSGHEQASKLVREGTTATGWKVSLYRDEWLRLRLALRDGNRVRVSAVDRVKVRAGKWKRTSRGKQKWKSGRSDWISTLELQLVVNPEAYRVKAEAPPAGGPSPAVRQAAAGAPAALTLVHPITPTSFDAAQALGAVAGLYGRLERLAPAGA